MCASLTQLNVSFCSHVGAARYILIDIDKYFYCISLLSLSPPLCRSPASPGRWHEWKLIYTYRYTYILFNINYIDTCNLINYIFTILKRGVLNISIDIDQCALRIWRSVSLCLRIWFKLISSCCFFCTLCCAKPCAHAHVCI